MIRSMLFVPADSQRKLEKSLGSGADALIFDLEDAVSLERKQAARDCLAAFLEQCHGLSEPLPALYVRVNALSTGMTLADLQAVMPQRPKGIVLPKCGGPRDLEQLSYYLDAFEQVHPRLPGQEQTRIIAIVTETADSLSNLDQYAKHPNPRLEGMMWGAEDLAGDIGARSNKSLADPRAWSATFSLARTLCLLGAAAAEVQAIDTVPTEIHNTEALQAEAREAYRDGFTAKAAIHPVQVGVINEAMTPDAQAVEWARAVVRAFDANAAVGVATLDGKMLDKPHLKLARKILDASGV